MTVPQGGTFPREGAVSGSSHSPEDNDSYRQRGLGLGVFGYDTQRIYFS